MSAYHQTATGFYLALFGLGLWLVAMLDPEVRRRDLLYWALTVGGLFSLIVGSHLAAAGLVP